MLFIAIAAAIALLVIIRLFFVVIKWEIRWDIRIFEFGIHCFLLGIIATFIAMVYFGWILI